MQLENHALLLTRSRNISSNTRWVWVSEGYRTLNSEPLGRILVPLLIKTAPYFWQGLVSTANEGNWWQLFFALWHAWFPTGDSLCRNGSCDKTVEPHPARLQIPTNTGKP